MVVPQRKPMPLEAEGGCTISDSEFEEFSALLFKFSGIRLPQKKKFLLVSRLGKRVRKYGLDSFAEYFKMATCPGNESEKKQMINLLTTNETYFFREPKHLDFLRDHIIGSNKRRSLRVWSAASSSGEEPYSLAMVLASAMGMSGNWHIYATDINCQVLEVARKGRYMMEASGRIPSDFLRLFCLRGIDDEERLFSNK